MAKDNTQLKVKKASQLKPMYLIAGDEEFIAYDAIITLKKLFSEKKECDWESREYKSKEGPLTDILDEFYSEGIFSERLGLHLQLSHTAFKNAQKKLEAYWKLSFKDRLLILEITDWHYKTRNALNLSFAKKILAENDCTLHNRRLFETIPPWGQYPWDSELCQWTLKRAKAKFGLDISGKEVQALTERTGNDPGRLAGELEKLHLYMGNNRKVNMETIVSLIPDMHSSPMQSLMDAVMNLNERKVFKTLHHIENAGLALGGQDIHQSEAQTPIILNQLQDTIRWIMIAQRYTKRHSDTMNPSQGFLKENSKIYSVSQGRGEDNLTRAKADKIVAASKRVRFETLTQWHQLVHQTMRHSRQGKKQKTALFQLFVDMFEKKLLR